jgi:hypothetical protein
MTGSDLNRVIDDVARRMTAGRAAPDVRSRVLDRLDDRPLWHWRLALVPTAIALAIAVVILARSTNRPAVIATDSTRAPETAQLPRGQERPASSKTPSIGVSPRPAGDGEAHRIGTMAPPSELQELAIPFLGAPEAVTLVSIQPEALEIRPLDTAPLVIPPLDDDTSQR